MYLNNSSKISEDINHGNCYFSCSSARVYWDKYLKSLSRKYQQYFRFVQFWQISFKIRALSKGSKVSRSYPFYRYSPRFPGVMATICNRFSMKYRSIVVLFYKMTYFSWQKRNELKYSLPDEMAAPMNDCESIFTNEIAANLSQIFRPFWTKLRRLGFPQPNKW